MHVRALTPNDAADAIALYTELTLGPAPSGPDAFLAVLDHAGTTVVSAQIGGRVRAMLTLHLLPNVTWGERPYGLIENVITAASHQGQGIGKALMRHAFAAAWAQNAFKIMLMTGTRRDAVGFYQSCGFSNADKHAMVIRRP